MKSPYKILCIDDDLDLLETIADLFRRDFNAVIDTVAGVPEAISALSERGPYDLLVSDYQLPPHTAADLFHHLRVNRIPSKFAVYSAFDHISQAHFDGDTYLGLVRKPDHGALLELLVPIVPARAR